MAGITRLDPPIWVMTPLGEADVEFLIDRGPEHHVQWICWVHKTGECWSLRNTEVRRITNVTMGRDSVTPFDEETLERFRRFNRD